MNNATLVLNASFPERFRLLFETVSLIEYWRRIRHGLRQPKDTGDHKFARLQLLRLSAWGAALAAPCLAVLTVLWMPAFRPGMASDGVVITITPVLEKPPILDPIIPVTPPLIPATTPLTPDTSMPGQDMDRDLLGPVAKAPLTINPNAVAPVKSPLKFKGLISGGGDGDGERRRAVNDRADTPEEDAILRSLRWLKRVQLPDGSWEKTKPAMTGLALLCFLGHGELPEYEEFGPTLQQGVQWLLDNQEADGHFRGRDGHDYSQPIAAYALCEAFSVIRNPAIRYAAERAIAPIIAGQHPSGGWDYNCRQSDRDDLSYTGWCIQALKAARIAKVGGEAAVLNSALRRAANGVKKNFGLRDGYGGFGYTSPGTPDNGLTGVGVLSLQLIGAAGDPEARAGLLALEKWTFQWNAPRGTSPIYYWYYMTQAKFINGGPGWLSWQKQFTRELCRSQIIENGKAQDSAATAPVGYWDSPSPSEHHDGRVMDTCLCTLMLEVFYRYLPMFRTGVPEQDGRPASPDAVRVIVALDEAQPPA